MELNDIQIEFMGVKIFLEINDFEEYWYCKKCNLVWLKNKSLVKLKDKIKKSLNKSKKFKHIDAIYQTNYEFKEISITNIEDNGDIWINSSGKRRKIYKYNVHSIYKKNNKNIEKVKLINCKNNEIQGLENTRYEIVNSLERLWTNEETAINN